jgi:hypothetical protein
LGEHGYRVGKGINQQRLSKLDIEEHQTGNNGIVYGSRRKRDYCGRIRVSIYHSRIATSFPQMKEEDGWVGSR